MRYRFAIALVVGALLFAPSGPAKADADGLSYWLAELAEPYAA